MSEPLLVVVGPTGTGKTALAIELARLVGGEVISADSVQVYRHFDVGSGKPNTEQLSAAPHHLVDVRDPLEPLDASDWAGLADACIEQLRARGKRPIVCGGTFLWVRALLWGLVEAPPADERLREELRSQAEAEGRGALHAQLAQVDPAAAARLHPNDFVRVSRALEVHRLTGRPLSELQRSHGFQRLRYPAALLGLDWSREQHDRLVAGRVEAMLAAGWIDETRFLLEQGYGAARAMDAVGYRQVRSFVEASDSRITSDAALSQLHQDIVRVTRIFARRQRTWLRDQPVNWLSPDVLSSDAALREAVSQLRGIDDAH